MPYASQGWFPELLIARDATKFIISISHLAAIRRARRSLASGVRDERAEALAGRIAAAHKL
ncbi:MULTISPECIES: hypothetical protein [unclassified Lysobacter]|uniref:hypothetical protein n=1 Tax=unclassified Lysobacter TaxID=2635362 RepID=UPI0012F93158|nr:MULTISPECIES: hypothetical protein [unclassified Lysobacter]